MMESAGLINRYVCDNCGAVHGTINLNSGVTPFLIQCRGCDKGMAQSSMYNMPPGRIGCGWAWYRPTADDFRQLDQENQEHVFGGGLLLGDLESVIWMREPEEPFRTEHGRFDAKRWMAYAVDAYKPSPELIGIVARRMGFTGEQVSQPKDR